MLKTALTFERPLPTFELAETSLGMGASLGNSALWLQTKGTGAIERVFLNEIGQTLVGAVTLRYGGRARELPDETYVGTYPAKGSRTFEIHPAYQRVRFQVGRVLDIEETTFLPIGEFGVRDASLVHVMVHVHNRDAFAHPLRMTGSAMLRGSTPSDIRSYFDENARALVAFNEQHPEWVRAFTVSEPARYEVDQDLGSTYDPSEVRALNNVAGATGDVIGHLQADVILAPGESRELVFTLALSASGANDALRTLAEAGSAAQSLQRSIEQLQRDLCRSAVLTPDRSINDGALWSKANMRRVMAFYNTGQAFTNDPGQSTNVVVRDCAWFVFGNDHFLPEFSRELLDAIASRQYANGKLPEYYDAVDGRIEDYGLNINDDTPLFILAVNHHSRATGDVDWLRRTYPSVARAARYIISQIDSRGLVFCTADDPRGNIWAIAGWRNIIDGYSISGAVTEINAECVAALRAAAHLADNLGGLEDDSQTFGRASERLKMAMDEHLINPRNGLYYLNIDVDGTPRTDVTADQIFPVIMRACSDETAFKIISRLNFEDFWTDAGLRTVSRYDPRYEPLAYAGLLGGVWPGLTWWFAFGAARYHPEVMVRALRSSFAHYGADPKGNNTVPGQFSEWFDGESLENRGMRLSPWEPPRFLWAAIEGICGLVLTPGIPRINPLIPAQWKWIGIRNHAYHDALVSYFIVREGTSGFRIYTTTPVESESGVFVYDRDASEELRVYDDSIVAMLLVRNDGAVVLLGNLSAQTVQTPVILNAPNVAPQNFDVRTYNSERGDWETTGVRSIEQLRAHAFSIEAYGFRLIELSLCES